MSRARGHKEGAIYTGGKSPPLSPVPQPEQAMDVRALPNDRVGTHLAKRDAYNLPTRPTCAEAGAVALSPSYQATAEADAAKQLSVAGVRLAYVLNEALGDGR